MFTWLLYKSIENHPSLLKLNSSTQPVRNNVKPKDCMWPKYILNVAFALTSKTILMLEMWTLRIFLGRQLSLTAEK